MTLRCWFFGHRWKLVEYDDSEDLSHPLGVLYCDRCHRDKVGQDVKRQFSADQLGEYVILSGRESTRRGEVGR